MTFPPATPGVAPPADTPDVPDIPTEPPDEPLAEPPAEPLAARVAGLLEGMRYVLWQMAAWFGGYRLRLRRVSHRLALLAQRVAAVAAQIEAGTWRQRPPRVRAALSPEAQEEARIAARVARAMRGPERQPLGWLLDLADSADLEFCAERLRGMLTEPALHALLAAAPSLMRQFRPLCRMLGVGPQPDFPPELFPPRMPKPRPPPQASEGPEPEPFVYYSAAPPIVASRYGPPDWRDTTRTHTRTMRLGSFIIERPKHLRTKRRKNPA